MSPRTRDILDTVLTLALAAAIGLLLAWRG